MMSFLSTNRVIFILLMVIIVLSAVIVTNPLEQKQTKQMDPYSVFKEANRLYKAGDYKNAIRNFDSHLIKYPGDLDGYINRGAAYQKAGDLDKAIKDYQKAQKLDARRSNHLLDNNIGTIYYQKGDINTAIKYFSASIKNSKGKHVNAFINRAIAYELKGDYKSACLNFKEALFQKQLLLFPKQKDQKSNRSFDDKTKVAKRKEAPYN